MSKKGFTLIELLAVIVVLAIIALIATPIVLNTIEDSRKGAAKASATAYMNGIETKVIVSMMTSDKIEHGEYTIGEIDVNVKGSKPDKGVLCVGEDGSVTKYSIEISGYTIEYNGFTQTITKEEETKTSLTCINSKYVGEYKEGVPYSKDDIVLWNGEYYQYLEDRSVDAGTYIELLSMNGCDAGYVRYLPNYKVSYTEIDENFKGSSLSSLGMQIASNSNRNNLIFYIEYSDTYKTGAGAGSGHFPGKPLQNYNPYDNTTWPAF